MQPYLNVYQMMKLMCSLGLYYFKTSLSQKDSGLKNVRASLWHTRPLHPALRENHSNISPIKLKSVWTAVTVTANSVHQGITRLKFVICCLFVSFVLSITRTSHMWQPCQFWCESQSRCTVLLKTCPFSVHK